jgi:hypothetical protein
MAPWRVTTTRRSVVVDAARGIDAVWRVGREGLDEHVVSVERVVRPSRMRGGLGRSLAAVLGGEVPMADASRPGPPPMTPPRPVAPLPHPSLPASTPTPAVPTGALSVDAVLGALVARSAAEGWFVLWWVESSRPGAALGRVWAIRSDGAAEEFDGELVSRTAAARRARELRLPLRLRDEPMPATLSAPNVARGGWAGRRSG